VVLHNQPGGLGAVKGLELLCTCPRHSQTSATEVSASCCQNVPAVGWSCVAGSGVQHQESLTHCPLVLGAGRDHSAIGQGVLVVESNAAQEGGRTGIHSVIPTEPCTQ
jgi:hypothetical protein